MDKRIKKLWIKALRSGKYKQAEGQLRVQVGDREPMFCCLGVLCDLHARTKDGVTWSDGSYFCNTTVLPPEVMNWAGLEFADPKLGRTHTASMLNDRGNGFGFIADRIEKYL